MKVITISDLPSKPYMHPADIFKYMAENMNFNEVDFEVQNDGTVSYKFTVGDVNVPKEFIESLKIISKNSNTSYANYKIPQLSVSYVVSKTGNEILVIQERVFHRGVTVNNDKVTIDHINLNNKTTIKGAPTFHIYDKGKVWNYTVKEDNRKPKGFPCSMKDFFYYQDKSNLISQVIYLLFKYWGKEYYLWRDLAEDFNNGTAYSSIPLDLIFTCYSKKQLINEYYGISLNRINKENIGKGIFLARAVKYVDEKDYQMLFDYNVPIAHITRDRRSMEKPLAQILYDNLKKQYPEMRTYHGIFVTYNIVSDTVRMALSLKEPLRLRYNSLQTFIDFHNMLAFKFRDNYNLPKVKIPKDSKFKKLKMPENCIRLTTRKAFVEEGVFQNNCVTSYITFVNKDYCSIWSMRKDNGERFTIEIRIRTSKNNPNGYFYIAQMRGYSNKDAPNKDKLLVKECLSHSVVYKPKI